VAEEEEEEEGGGARGEVNVEAEEGVNLDAWTEAKEEDEEKGEKGVEVPMDMAKGGGGKEG
ncbi:hypothetical protein HMI55_000460, partial [Coelomomyces lativittatus]